MKRRFLPTLHQNALLQNEYSFRGQQYNTSSTLSQHLNILEWLPNELAMCLKY